MNLLLPSIFCETIYDTATFMAELQAAAAKRIPITIETEPHVRVQIKNHRTIFSWSTWLAVWIMAGASKEANAAEHGSHSLIVHVWYWTSMSWSIDSFQNKVSADQYYVTISQAQLKSSSRSPVFWKVDRWQSTGFLLDRGLKLG